MFTNKYASATGLWKGGPMALSTDEMGRALLRLQRRWLEDGRQIYILMEKFFEEIGRAHV